MILAALLLAGKAALAGSGAEACGLRTVGAMIAAPMPPYGPRAPLLASIELPASQIAGFGPRQDFPATLVLPPEARQATGIRRIRKLRQLGEGGMGKVFEVEVEYEGGARRVFAWKELSPEEGLRKIHPESLAAEWVGHNLHYEAALREDHILPVERLFRVVNAHGETLNLGILYEAAGNNLENLIATQTLRRLGFSKRLLMAERVASQMSRALATLRKRGSVHHDLKPANILVRGGETNGLGEVLSGKARLELADFGLASMEGDSFSAPAGTPAYWPPGFVYDFSHRAANDLYAHGILLTEILLMKVATNPTGGYRRGQYPRPGFSPHEVAAALAAERKAHAKTATLHELKRFDHLAQYILRSIDELEHVRPREVFEPAEPPR